MSVTKTQVLGEAARGRVFHPVARPVDERALEADLRKTVRGEVRFDGGFKALYAAGGGNYRQIPIGVVVPLDVDDVIAAVAACHAHGAPVLPRGNGTSLGGQVCNVAVVIDCSKNLRAIHEIDPVRRLARVSPGTVLDHLRQEAEKKYQLTFGPDPSTHVSCTFGGMLGNDSCGTHAQMAGRCADNVESMDVLTYDGLRLRVGPTSEAQLEAFIAEGGRRGEIYRGLRSLRDRYSDLVRARYPRIPRRVSGYNLDELLPERGFNVARALVGSEGTCVTILEATVDLVRSPPARAVVLLGYPSIFEAADHLLEVLSHAPIALEALDQRLVDNNRKLGKHVEALDLLVPGHGWLLVEFGGETQEEADGRARDLMRDLEGVPAAPSMELIGDKKRVAEIWELRESGLGATAIVPGEPDTWEGWEDSAAPPERMGEYLRGLQKLFDKFGYYGALYGHFGQGCVHTRINFDLVTAEGIAKFRRFLHEAADLVVSVGGSLSGEHGDGQARGELLEKMFGPELIQAFREFKSIWDPEWRMNPGKKIDAYRVDENLRLGTDYNPPRLATHFQFPDDAFSFGRAAKRCVGVAKCRRTEGGVMCPSYMVTKDEMHSTRGRARLLFEMLEGDVVSGWKDEHVREALDLCLACKGCKGECPVNVDMATYKAEFLSHYYEGRLRPRSAYAMGLIMYWARLARVAPQLANFLTHAPVLSGLMKKAAGIARERTAPEFAPESFREWFARRPARTEGRRGPIILWPDTFNDQFHPQVARAATIVLEEAGYSVSIPRAGLCCGRPLYDYGMLELAKKHLLDILDALRPQIRAGVPLVGLEPSCVAVFRDELRNLFPHDQDALRLGKQAFDLGELLLRTDGWEAPKLLGNAIVHGHCHQTAVMGMKPEIEVLKKMGLEAELLESGCCGMAGSFGFEEEHYEISQKCGERALFPRVKGEAPSTLLVADGFSCKHQIREATDRRALHLAEVIHLALVGGPRALHGPYPERDYLEAARRPFDSRRSRLRSVAVVAGLAVLGGLALRRLGSRGA
jgi:FAD/FMN-containing dehydrogenase/Fe-S oxidoreductase